MLTTIILPILPIVAAMILAQTPTSGAAIPRNQYITIASYNIRYATADDGPNHWNIRRDLLINTIRDLDADILTLQEALLIQIDEITNALDHYTVIGVGRDDARTRGEFSPILIRHHRFLIAESDTFWLSDTPKHPGSRSWGNRIPRICTWARLIDRDTGAALYVFNTHFDHESQPARENSARLILQRIAQRTHDDPIVLTGDLNAPEENPAINILRDADSPRATLIDSFRAIHPDQTTIGTFTAFDPDQIHGPKIDYIWTSPNLHILDASIIRARSDDGARTPSDHEPVTATLRHPADER